MSLRDKLVNALEVAESQAEQERLEIVNLTRGKSEAESRKIWEEEGQVILQYYVEEVTVAESNLILHDAMRYHLPVPDWSDNKSWEVSRMSNSRFLTQQARRQVQRALLEEGRRDTDFRRARMSGRVGIIGLMVAAIALLKDVPLGAFLIELVVALKD
ncbi:MAG: hypothetical protein JKY31_03945 [Rhodobacteraceae bacterium]|nr:hypothetical protein [Paracoccaceae bacterium]